MAVACVHEAEEARHLECLVCAAVCRGQGTVHQANAVACIHAHAGGHYGEIAVVVAPVGHIRNTRAEAALIQAVCVLVGVERRLAVLRAHDYLKEELHHELSHEPVGLPALAALACVCAEVGCADIGCSHAQHTELRRVLRWCFRVAGGFQGCAAAATVLLRAAYHAAQHLVCSVHYASTEPACAACWYADAHAVTHGLVERDALHQ